MDLGIAGRKAIVCASSRGLGRACARALAEAGCEVVINGRDAKKLEAVAAELKSLTGAKVTAVAGDVATPEGQKALLAACPDARHSDQQQRRPAISRFPRTRPAEHDRRRDRQHDRGGGTDSAGARPDGEPKFGRIVNITSGTVKMPLVGLDLSSGARAGLTAFLAGVSRSVAASNVTINFMLPGAFDTDRLRGSLSKTPK